MQNVTLIKVFRYTLSGWPDSTGDILLLPYYKRREEISIDSGCLLLGPRVVIPQRLRRSILEELHVSHPGITKMKALGRSYVWWPSIDNDIEDTVNNCTTCQAMRNSTLC